MVLRNYTKHTILFFAFFGLLFLFTFPVMRNFNTTAYGPLYGTDNRAAIWHFWWFHYVSSNHLPLASTTVINYPFGVTDLAPRIFPLCVIPAYLLSSLVNEIFSYNFLILLSFCLSYIMMYLLVFHVTRNRYAAFISGLMYSFCPYHVNKSWEHFGLTFIEFFPLYVLGLLKLKEKVSLKNFFLCSIALLLVAMSDLTYGFIGAMFSLLFVIHLVWYLGRRRRWGELVRYSKTLLAVFVVVFILMLLVLWPTLESIFKVNAYVSLATPKVVVRPFKYLLSQSASLLAYVIPSHYHPLWGGIARGLEGSVFFGRGSIEQTLYLGWVGLVLAFIAIRSRSTISRNESERSQQHYIISLFSFVLLSAILISMPPYLNLFLFKIYFPSFFIYKIFPYFRAYARFGLLAMLSVSILAGIGIQHIAAYRLRSSGERLFFYSAICFLLILDFLNFPPFRYADLKVVPPEYTWLGQQKGNFVIVEYPIRLGDLSEGYVNLDYLLYQRIYKKPMVNGASPGTEGYALKQRLEKITDGQTVPLLRLMGVRYAVFHLDLYRAGNDRDAVDTIGQIPDFSHIKGLRFIKSFDNTRIYEIVGNKKNNKPVDLELIRSILSMKRSKA